MWPDNNYSTPSSTRINLRSILMLYWLLVVVSLIFIVKFVNMIHPGGLDVMIASFFLCLAVSLSIVLKRHLRDLDRALVHLRESEDQAWEVTRSKSEFVANMSHEIRTPMNAILGFSDLLHRTDLNKGQKLYLENISSSGHMLLNIINDILDYSKLEAGKIRLEVIDFDIEYLINDVFKMIIARVMDKPIDMYIDIAKDVPRNLCGDPTRLRQILINLLGNAVKFTAQGEIGVIVLVDKVMASDRSALLRFKVKDTGLGIPLSQQKKIFDLYSQADVSTTRKFGGTGLGLAICKSIVEAMDGQIWVESMEAQGSEFNFTVKFGVSEEVGKRQIFPLSSKDLKAKKVIIVDDNEKARRINQDSCGIMGMDVVHVTSTGQSVLNKIDELIAADDRPDLLLCDIRMKPMDGHELVRRIRSSGKCRGLKIIAVTGDAKVGLANQAREIGFDGFLTKPVVYDELAKVVATVLGDQRTEGPIVTRHMAEEIACKGRRILVAEDSDTNQDLMRAYLTTFGCTGDYVHNGKEALEKLQAGERYDMCLMDVHMPIMDGIEAAKIIRRDISEDFPIIALTASAMKDDKERCLQAGMNDYLLKPINMTNLKEKILKHTCEQSNSKTQTD